MEHDELMMFYSKHARPTQWGDTKVITPKQFRKLKSAEGEFMFVVSAASEKSERQLHTDWESLRGQPAERVVLKYKDTVFRAELPDTPPTRTCDVEAEIELSDASLVARKQFRLSDEAKQAFSVFEDQREFCRVYFDDLFVFTKTDSVEDHLDALDRVLARCEEQQLYIKLAKCTFCAEEIPCLGDFIGKDGVRMDPDKIRAIRDWPLPRTKRDLQSFLGTCVYVLRYCPDFAELAAPLTEATKGKTKHEHVALDDHQRQCFAALKSRLSSPPVLAHPDSSLPFHVKMDASDYAVGGYLYQVGDDGHERIIAYGCRKLTTAERMYPTREKELLAALHAMRTWKVYLLDKPFFVNTDHKTLESILLQSTCSQRLARWLNELSFYQPRFRWIPGDTNIVADAISRSPQLADDDRPSHVSIGSLLAQLQEQQATVSTDEALVAYMSQRPSIQVQCKRLYAEDPVFGPLVAHLSRDGATGAPPVELNRALRANFEHFALEDGLLYYESGPEEPRRLCVPCDTDLRNLVLFEHHDTVAHGHPGSTKTLAAVQRRFFWPHMAKTVAKYVRTCELCQRTKASRQKPAGLLHPLDIPHARWTHVSMDFMPDLPRSGPDQHDTIVVILDRLTKRAHFVATHKTASAQDVALLFVREHVRLHGFPLSIVCDRDSRFLSAFWTAVAATQRSQIHASTAFKPSTDGQNERSHAFSNDYFRAFVSPTQEDWTDLLPLAEFAYNGRVHSSIGTSPFHADLGYEPRAFADLALPDGPRRKNHGLSFAEYQEATLRRCRDALEAANASMKRFYDQNRPDVQFKVGDAVLLDTLNLDLAHVGTTGRRKFAARFIGPYKVTACTTRTTYRISLPPGIRLHDEFHVSYLRRYHEDTDPNRLNHVPRLITRDGTEGQQIRAIVDKRTHRGELQYKVRWYGRARRGAVT
ncbi:hypothetical protein ATCC90586_002200 [Pythium insidiosum]|nr:hypothetical protein ATCC90586_002200 [Pythium insidiosum]